MGLLTFTEDGTQLNINTLQTTPEITVSETVENAADIKINGYEFDVSEDGDYADVQVKPLMSHNIYVYGTDTEQVPTPFENGISMKDVTGNVIPTLVKSFSPAAQRWAEGYALGFNYIYIMRDSTIYRTSLIDGSEVSIDLGEITAYEKLTLHDENTCFVIYNGEDLSGNNIQKLAKVDFCNSSFSIIETKSETFEADGATWTINESVFICKVEYDDVDYIVVGLNLEPDDSENYGWRIEFWIYNITADSIYQSGGKDLNDTYDLDNGFNYITPPKIYQDKVVITVSTLGFNYTTPDPPVNFCGWPTFIIDCSGESVTRVNDSVFSSDDYPNALWGSGVDHNAGYYYFWLEGIDSSGNNALMRINLATNTTTRIFTTSDDVTLYQGRNKVYGLNGTGDSQVVVLIPSMNQRGTLYNPYKSAVVDEQNNMIWAFDDVGSTSRIHGASTIYGSAQSISIPSWVLTAPFTHPYSQDIELFIIAGTAIIVVSSRDVLPTVIQLDMYIVRENISCS